MYSTCTKHNILLVSTVSDVVEGVRRHNNNSIINVQTVQEVATRRLFRVRDAQEFSPFGGDCRGRRVVVAREYVNGRPKRTRRQVRRDRPVGRVHRRRRLGDGRQVENRERSDGAAGPARRRVARSLRRRLRRSGPRNCVSALVRGRPSRGHRRRARPVHADVGETRTRRRSGADRSAGRRRPPSRRRRDGRADERGRSALGQQKPEQSVRDPRRAVPGRGRKGGPRAGAHNRHRGAVARRRRGGDGHRFRDRRGRRARRPPSDVRAVEASVPERSVRRQRGGGAADAARRAADRARPVPGAGRREQRVQDAQDRPRPEADGGSVEARPDGILPMDLELAVRVSP